MNRFSFLLAAVLLSVAGHAAAGMETIAPLSVPPGTLPRAIVDVPDYTKQPVNQVQRRYHRTKRIPDEWCCIAR